MGTDNGFDEVAEVRGESSNRNQGCDCSPATVRRAVVPISDRLMPVLEACKQEFGEKQFVLGRKTPLWYPFRQAADKAGLFDVVFHDLRRTWATWAAQRGMPIYEISDVLADNPITVLRTYRQYMPHDALRGAVNWLREDEMAAE